MINNLTTYPYGAIVNNECTQINSAHQNDITQYMSQANAFGYAIGGLSNTAQTYQVTIQQPVELPRETHNCEGCNAKDGEFHKDNCWYVRCECHSERASRIHGALWLLKREITNWHGNVLER